MVAHPNTLEPNPEPWRKYGITTIIGIVAGVVGGTLLSNAIHDITLFFGTRHNYFWLGGLCSIWNCY